MNLEYWQQCDLDSKTLDWTFFVILSQNAKVKVDLCSDLFPSQLTFWVLSHHQHNSPRNPKWTSINQSNTTKKSWPW